jgi:hypothetical protein
MTSELRNPGAPSAASARRPRWLPASQSGSDHSSDQPKRANAARYNRHFPSRAHPLRLFILMISKIRKRIDRQDRASSCQLLYCLAIFSESGFLARAVQ